VGKKLYEELYHFCFSPSIIRIKEDEIGRAFSTHETEMHMQNFDRQI
jgi:hypothetical protein